MPPKFLLRTRIKAYPAEFSLTKIGCGVKTAPDFFNDFLVFSGRVWYTRHVVNLKGDFYV